MNAEWLESLRKRAAAMRIRFSGEASDLADLIEDVISELRDEALRDDRNGGPKE